jgi:hypothetical protein
MTMTTKGKAEKKENRAPKEKRHFNASEKVQAVLSIWTERRKPSEVCKELEINWANLRHWENRALEGMMEALEPRTRKEEERGPALGTKLQRLLEKSSARRLGEMSKLHRRLTKIQEARRENLAKEATA